MKSAVTRIDWNTFQYLFSSDPRTAFQQLAEQLFCYEYHQPYGVYRYFNQPYIETMPVRLDNAYVGFQAKYYDAATNLSTKKGELIEAITGASERYLGINKIVFYLNKEPGFSRKSDKEKPEYIEEIERHGKKCGIQVEWRGPNQMEALLLHPEIESIRDYFFAVDSGPRSFFSQLKLHMKAIFESISSNIHFNGRTIKVTRKQIDLNAFQNSDHDMLLIYGEGGCGKSGLVKDLFENENDHPLLLFKATDFDTPSLPEFTQKFGDSTWEEFLQIFDHASLKICIIDSAEKIFTMTHQETFKSAVHLLREHGWRVIITIRTAYRDIFLNTILQTTDIDEHLVETLSAEDLSTLEAENGLTLPTDIKLRDFLQNLFYLKIYLSIPDNSPGGSVAEFKKRIWDEVICGSARQAGAMHHRRELTICHVVRTNTLNGTAYYSPSTDADWDALNFLTADGIIHYDDMMSGYFVTHDVYEETILKHILSLAYRQKHSSEDFFLSIGDGLVMRKAFRLWLHDQFETKNDEISNFLADVLIKENQNFLWTDEIIIALMSDDDTSYIALLDSILQENDYKLFFHALNLLNTACRSVNNHFLQQILNKDETKTFNIYRFTKPAGIGWDYLISYAYTHRESIPRSPVAIMLIVDVLREWTNSFPIGETTRKAGLIALYLYQLAISKEYRYLLHEKKIEKIFITIFNSAREILPELTTICDIVLAEGKVDYRSIHSNLFEFLLDSVINCGSMCTAAPDLVLQLARHFWLGYEESSKYELFTHNISTKFGLNPHIDYKHHPTSAFQTPIFVLLQAKPMETIDFMIELFDITTEAYRNSSLNLDYNECFDITLIFPNGSQTVQTASSRLWNMYRGTSAAPNLLESVLMALERWLYFNLPELDTDTAVKICIRLLSKSHSAAITAVVTSMVIAFPDKLFPLACTILHTRDIFLLDNTRITKERTANYFRGLNKSNKLYDDERIKSNALPFRKKCLEDTILEYQIKQDTLPENIFQERLQKIYMAIDETFKNVEELSENEQFTLYRIDIRKMKLEKYQTEKEVQIALVSDLPENLIQTQCEVQESVKGNNKYIQLFLWSQSRLEHKSAEYQKYEQYEHDPLSALNDAIAILSEPGPFQNDNNILIYVSAVLINDFAASVNEEILQICEHGIKRYLFENITAQAFQTANDGIDAAIATLPALITHRNGCSLFDDPAVLWLMLICAQDNRRDSAVKVFREKLWTANTILAQNILTAFVFFKPQYDREVLNYHGITPVQFFQNNEGALKVVFGQVNSKKLVVFDELSECALQTLSLLVPVDASIAQTILFETGRLFWPQFFKDRDYSDSNRDHDQERKYLNWLAEYLLCSSEQAQHEAVSKLAPHIGISDIVAKLLTDIITLEDHLEKPQSFWHLWNELFPIVERLCMQKKDRLCSTQARSIDQYYGGELDEIVTTYLLAFPWWREGTHSWHTLQKENAAFFARSSAILGYHPGTIYSIARVLNTIGYNYLNYGVRWLAEIIRNNPHLREGSLQINTEYYIEEYIQRFIIANRLNIKQTPEQRQFVIDILNFLVSRGSTCGFMLRESLC